MILQGNKKRNLILTVALVFLVTQIIFRSVKVTSSAHSKSLHNQVQKTRLIQKQVGDSELKNNFKNIGKGLDRLASDLTLREQLAFHFPYQPSLPLSKKIWQTWKTSLKDDKFPRNFRTYSSSWPLNNPGYSHEVIPDLHVEEMVKHMYIQVPMVYELYKMMPKSILKLDFFRYLVLYLRGGTYSDIDTINLKPIDTWDTFNKTIDGVPNNPGLIIGIELDPDRPDWADWYLRRIQFCQWTIQLKAGHPLLRELIALITEITFRKRDTGYLTKIEGKDAGGDIMNWTGPGIFTDMVFKYLNNVHGDTSDDPQLITWKNFTGMEKSRVFDDVLVLPITGFSPGVGQMGARDVNHPSLYVRHMFQGSWKPSKDRQIGKSKEEILLMNL